MRDEEGILPDEAVGVEVQSKMDGEVTDANLEVVKLIREEPINSAGYQMRRKKKPIIGTELVLL